VIVYSDVYLRKLWTIYEVACFLVAGPKHRRIDVIHSALAPIALSAYTIIYFLYFAWYVPHIPLGTVLLPVFIAILAACIAILLRKLQQSLALTWQRVANFRVAEAMCFNEDDREVVEGNIEAFLKCLAYLPYDGCRAEALGVLGEFSWGPQPSFNSQLFI